MRLALRPSRAVTRVIGVGTTVTGAAASAAVVWHSSYSATTADPTNNWAAANIALTDDDTKTYQFVWTLDPNTPNTAQSGTAAIGFTWEAQNS